jgi:hypothetical protein
MPMTSKPSFDWFGFWVRFFFGALFGVFFAFGWWIRGDPGAVSGWIVMPSIAIPFGILAGLWGDEFWHTLVSWLRWFF